MSTKASSCAEPPERCGWRANKACSTRASSSSMAIRSCRSEFEPVWQAFQASGQPALMTVLRNEGRWDRSNVIYQPGRVVLYDKAAAPGMQYIDYGLSCFRRDLLDGPTPSDLAASVSRTQREGRLAGFRSPRALLRNRIARRAPRFRAVPDELRSCPFVAIVFINAPPRSETEKSATSKFPPPTSPARRTFTNASSAGASAERPDGSVTFDDGEGQVSGTWRLDRAPCAALGLMVYIMVDSAAATLDLIVQNGGEVVQPIGADAPEITARFRDPGGNVIGIYQHRG